MAVYEFSHLPYLYYLRPRTSCAYTLVFWVQLFRQTEDMIPTSLFYLPPPYQNSNSLWPKAAQITEFAMTSHRWWRASWIIAECGLIGSREKYKSFHCFLSIRVLKFLIHSKQKNHNKACPRMRSRFETERLKSSMCVFQ